MKVSFFVTMFLLMSVVASTAVSQIPNPGFETWSGGSPAGWLAANSSEVTTVTQVNDPHSGSAAAFGRIVMIAPGAFVSPVLAAGSDGGGFPVNFRPEALRGWYKFTGAGGDALVIATAFKLGENGIGAGNFSENNTRTIYREFVAPIHWVSTEVPELATINVVIVGGGTTFHEGSSYVLDDLAWGSATTDVPGRGASLPRTFVLEQNFPNSFNPTTKIQFEIPDERIVTLRVYNILGQEVATLVNDRLDAGHYRTEFNGTGLASGTYIYKLQAGSFTATRKFQFVR